MEKSINEKQQKHDPTIASGLEMDELEEDATSEEIRNEDSTSVTKLFRDRI